LLFCSIRLNSQVSVPAKMFEFKIVIVTMVAFSGLKVVHGKVLNCATGPTLRQFECSFDRQELGISDTATFIVALKSDLTPADISYIYFNYN
jgi:hypothetical protein